MNANPEQETGVKKYLKLETLQELWRDFHDKAYPNGTVPDQQRQLHQAFFASAFVVLHQVSLLSTLPEDQALVAVEKLFKEAEAVCCANSILSKSLNPDGGPEA